ncbi:hypothetical protein [Paenibacillus koleovorans]|uniref:hypothetical protein n=1 Tax=Paenibacillus koleovorans TaxID=121608 RepID=UPI000FDC97F5|nr:hypothetical protein [Paenibacillus koleovorans]
MTPNRNFILLLAVAELVLAVTFASICGYFLIAKPDSLQLQLLLSFIGIAGLVNGIYLLRKIRQSRTAAGRRAERAAVAAASRQRASGGGGKGKSKR